MIYNCGGLDRSLKLQDLEEGIAVASRYRNRRLGDFPKEMDLTEGRSTGLSLIQAALRRNGSPKAVIESDEMRTYFRIIFKIHQSFEKEENFKEVKLNNEMEIANKLSLLLSYSDSVSDVADDLVIMAKILILIFNKRSNLSEIFATIGRKPHSDTRRRYINPLEKLNLIEKTIPDKITSPKQQYQITDKGAALFK
jgi:ATP-dependent DNA helicase RecG